VPFLPGRAAAKGLEPRAAAHHKVTTKPREILRFFKKIQNPTCGGRKLSRRRVVTLPSQVGFCLTCGRRKSEKNEKIVEKGGGNRK